MDPRTSIAPKKNYFFLYFLAALILSLPFLARPLFNPDLFWHLSAGKFIAENHTVPRADFLSWTMRGAAWIDFEWLAQLIYYAIHISGGAAGLYFLKILLLAINLYFLGRAVVVSGARPVNLVWMLPLCSAAMFSAADLRPENFSAMFFSATLLLLERERRSPALSLRKALLFFFLYILWANIHGGFLYGLLLIGIYSAGDFAEGKILKKPSGWRVYLPYGLAAFTATLINPYGYGIYSVIRTHYSQSELLKNYICEWQTLNPGLRSMWPLTALMLSSAAAVLFRFFMGKDKIFNRLLLLSVFLYLSLAHMRNLNYSAMVFSFLLAAELSGKMRLKPLPAVGAAIVLPLLALYLKAAAQNYYRDFSVLRFSNSSQGLAAFLKKNARELGWLRMANPWEWGGWLGWELHPEYAVFVDGRYIFHNYLSELSDSIEYIDSWVKAEEKNRFELVIMTPGGRELKFKDTANAAWTLDKRRVFLPAEKWALVYFDSRIFAAVRRDSVSPAWLKKNEYIYLRPWGYENLLSKPLPYASGEKQAEKEMERYLREHGRDFHDQQLDSIAEWKKVKGKMTWDGGL